MTDKEKIKDIIQQYADKGIDNFHKALKDDGNEDAITKYWDGFSDCANLLLLEIDPIQEEPKECMYSKDHYTDEDRKVLCDGCKEECKFNKKEYSVNNGLDLGCGVIWRDEEPVSEDLEEAAQEYTEKGSKCQEELEAFKAGANWQKEHLITKGVDGVVHHFGKDEVASVHYNDPTGIPMAYYLSSEGLSAGDKVKIIVIKED